MSTVQLTNEAVEEVKQMLAKEKRSGLGLRLAVKGGGCSGLSYAMNFDEKKDKDAEFIFSGLNVYVDPKSLLYLNGVTLDYADSLQEKGFRFINPSASKTCGCGESFSV